MCLLVAVSCWKKAGEMLRVTHNLLAQDKRCIISLMEELSPPVLGNEAGTGENCLFLVSVLSPTQRPVSADVSEVPAMTLGRSQEDDDHSRFTIRTLRRSSDGQTTKESRFLHLSNPRYLCNPQRSNWYRWNNLGVDHPVLKWTFTFGHVSHPKLYS